MHKGALTLAWRLSSAGIAAVCCLAVWLLPPVQAYFAHMVKLPQMRLPYTASLFTLLAVGMMLFDDGWMTTARLAWVAIVGACVGELAAVIAITAANVFLPRGLDRSLGSLETFGFFNLLVIDFAVAGLLASWLFGAAAFIVYRALIQYRHKGEGTAA